MGERTDVAAAANARLVPVVEYQRDERGASFFHRLAGVHQRGISGQATRPVVERNAWWNGRIHVSPQRFTGLAHLTSNGPRAYVPAAAELGEQPSGDLSDPALRLFASKEARRRR